MAAISPSFFQLGSDVSCLQAVTPGALSCSSQISGVTLSAWCKTLWHCISSSFWGKALCFPGILLSRDIPLSPGSPAALLIGPIRKLSYEFPVDEAALVSCWYEAAFQRLPIPAGVILVYFSCITLLMDSSGWGQGVPTVCLTPDSLPRHSWVPKENSKLIR